MERPFLPVQGPSLWPQPVSMGLHQCSQRLNDFLQSPGSQTSHLFRRLAPPLLLKGGMQRPPSISPFPGTQGGVQRQPGEIGTSSLPNLYLSGNVIRHHDGLRMPQPCEASRPLGPTRAVQLPKDSLRTDTFIPPRQDGVDGKPPSSGKSTQTSPPKSSVPEVLASKGQLGKIHPLTALVPICDSSVEEHNMAELVSPNTERGTEDYNLHGCLTERMGSPHGQQNCERKVASSYASIPYQQTGTGGSLPCTERISETHSTRSNQDYVGQSDCGSPHQQPRGHSLPINVRENRGNPTMGSQDGLDTLVSSRGRKRQRHGGSPQQTRFHHSNRMDPLPQRPSTSVDQVGTPTCGPLCHTLLEKTPDLRFSHPGPGGLGSGCHGNTLGEPNSLCIPTVQHDPEGGRQGKKRRTKTHPSNAIMAGETLVPYTEKNSSRTSRSPISTKQRPGSATLRDSSRQRRSPESSRLALVRKVLYRKGLSESAIDFHTAQHRQSTQKVYHHHWNYWVAWCRNKRIDPTRPSRKHVANHLAHLAKVKKLSIASIRTRRAAIGSTLLSIGYKNVPTDPMITNILKGIALEQAKLPSRTPAWDLKVILEFLKSAPYNDLKFVNYDKLTMKTAFLVALASGRRASEIINLSGLPKDVSHSPDGTITLRFRPDFLAKNQKPGEQSPVISIPPLSKLLEAGHEDMCNCPVRALKVYRKCSKPYRSEAQKALFLSLNKALNRDITSATLSRWIKSIIIEAYRSLRDKSNQWHKAVFPLTKARSHEVRAWATSVAAKSTPISEILRAAYWRSHSVFTKHYLRHTALGSEDDTWHLPAMVAAQTTIPADC